MSEPTPGLRERKKQATRAALSAAALELAVERGADNVTVEDIAAKVEVSTRTFFNYFSSKEEAVMADGQQRAEQLVAALHARPAKEPILTALRNAVLEVLGETGVPNKEWAQQVRLVRNTPSLLPQQLAEHAKAERMLVSAIAERTGTDPVRDMYPALVAGVASMAVRIAGERWLEHDSESLADLVVRALDQVAVNESALAK